MATEKRLIDANALSNDITGISKDIKRPGAVELACLLMIVEAPTVDAVEVIRCKDCASGKGATHKVCPLYKQGLMKDDDYCSVGERKDNG